MKNPFEAKGHLIILGPQASGKSTLARKVLARTGGGIEVNASEFLHPRGMNDDLFETKLSNLIVDEFEFHHKQLMQLKTIVMANEVLTRHGPNTYKRALPRLILCSSHLEAIANIKSLRHFTLIDMQSPVNSSEG